MGPKYPLRQPIASRERALDIWLCHPLDFTRPSQLGSRMSSTKLCEWLREEEQKEGRKRNKKRRGRRGGGGRGDEGTWSGATEAEWGDEMVPGLTTGLKASSFHRGFSSVLRRVFVYLSLSTLYFIEVFFYDPSTAERPSSLASLRSHRLCLWNTLHIERSSPTSCVEIEDKDLFLLLAQC